MGIGDCFIRVSDCSIMLIKEVEGKEGGWMGGHVD